MSSISIPDGKLWNSNDKRIPLLGFGSAESPFGSSHPEAVKDAILCAIELGYRHFDTASVYKNEEPLGEAISEALRLGIDTALVPVRFVSSIQVKSTLEMESKIPTAKLNDGGAIPLLGFGTAEFGSSTDEEVKEAIVHAIRLGYRHFDSAAVYGSEPPLGAAVEEALRLGLIKSRDELFITTKLWCTDAHPQLVLPAIQNSLKNLKVEYLDLYLIHFPVSFKPKAIEFPIKKEDIVPMNFKSVWEEMEKCKELSLTKSIGVSNFSCKKLEDLLATAKILPAVNQVELNPIWQQKKLRKFCEKHGIHISAYSPLGAIGKVWGSNLVMRSEVLKEIAIAHDKFVAKVALRWGYEQGVSVIVKSFNKERMEQNMDIFDWELSHEDLGKISQLPQRRFNTRHDFISNDGPYKSVEEFWDGEI